MALHISTEQINEIMQERTGLGETGETYLVGQDFLMRSDSRFSEESTIMKQKVDTENTRHCFTYEAKRLEHSWREEVRVFPDYRGVKVLGTHVYIPQVRWALLAEIDEEEALAPLDKLLWCFIIVGLTSVVVSYLLSGFVAARISRPIAKLKDATAEIGKGNLNTQIDLQLNDEIGQLADSFNKMTEDLKSTTTSIDNLNAANQQLEASHQQLEAMNEQLQSNEQQLRANNQQLQDEIAERERSERELRAAQGKLVETAREAGKAEMATSVLHNVGNVLNSINVAATLIREKVSNSEVLSLKKITDTILIPTLSGEDIFGMEGFKDMIDQRAVDIIHPDMETYVSDSGVARRLVF